MADARKKESTFIKHKTRISVYDIFVIKFHIIRFMFLQMTSKMTSDTPEILTSNQQKQLEL